MIDDSSEEESFSADLLKGIMMYGLKSSNSAKFDRYSWVNCDLNGFKNWAIVLELSSRVVINSGLIRIRLST